MPATPTAAVVIGDRNSVLDELTAKLAQLTPRVRISLLLRIGLPATDVIGTLDCVDHAGWRYLQERESLAFDGSVVWCTPCARWWKER